MKKKNVLLIFKNTTRLQEYDSWLFCRVVPEAPVCSVKVQWTFPRFLVSRRNELKVIRSRVKTLNEKVRLRKPQSIFLVYNFFDVVIFVVAWIILYSIKRMYASNWFFVWLWDMFLESSNHQSFIYPRQCNTSLMILNSFVSL